MNPGYVILKRSLLDYIRSSNSYISQNVLTEEFPDILINDSLDFENNDLLTSLINSLPLKQQSIIKDYILGLSYLEISKKYNIKYNSVKWYICTIRKEIQTKL